ncbi:hypothetical protein OC834_003531 [Tilletia horrida]|uniref:Topoisomerase I damage affected protein 2 n=1 Tax=Tilletia horrida TaxID=155126 RepID=A0AAN6GHM5_9BASI|nr:hypothetical protein OC835_006314 [Tilletia horrida]KAK0529824.1 hypothetical protein OC834_003531 [Tilletia horrida]KAK0534451.1 hypothetical protein OC842_002640 [Tilletia horrida]KAK0559764.1 hypothetical protein OC844_004191 [Tilletia horrida]
MSTPTSASGSGYGFPGPSAAASTSSSSAGGPAGAGVTASAGINAGAVSAASPSPYSGLPPPPPLLSATLLASASAGGANGASSGPSSSAPPSVRSTTASPRPKFETDTLSTYLRNHLAARLHGVAWNRDKDKTRALTTELAQSAKAKMLEIAPRGFKFVVNVQLVENLGQGGRGDMACHWEESDQVVQELYSNDRILCTVTCFAVRAF